MQKSIYALTLAVAGALAVTPALADGGKGRHRGKSRGGKVAQVYDVCVDGASGARLTSFPPGPGDRVTAVGMILPAGTVPADGTGDPTCAAYAADKIGSFFVNGTFVAAFAPDTNRLPEAAADDLGYVDWHFRVNGVGAFDTSGPIKQFVQGGTYPQTVTGGTGRYRGLKGTLTTTMLGAGGFQIRVQLPKSD